MTQTLRVGFIGLGYMGHGMARNILAAGFPLTVMAHRKREAVEDLVAKGAVEVSSARDLAARSDVVILCVTGAEQVDDLVRRSGGLAEGAGAGTIVVDCTTSAPDTLRALIGDFPDLRFVDAPLGRSPREAWAGRLAIMVGAAPEVLDTVRPVFESFADSILHAGPAGAGHTLKLVNNMISMGYAALFSEALVLARRAGISTGTFDELVSTSRMNCAFYQTFMGWARTGDATTHRFELGLGEHTVADAERLAEGFGLDLRLLPAIHDVFTRAVADGFADAHLPELPRAVAAACDLDIAPPGRTDR